MNTPPRLRRPARRRAPRNLALFGLVTLLANVGFLLALDYGPPRLRDPEYGRRLSALKARVAERPGRPVVLVLGSSRVAMGVRPGALPDGPGEPVIFSFALAGSGPIMELMAFRRALAHGVRPAAILIEYWPAFLREDEGYHEDARLDIARLGPTDWPLVRDYFRDQPDARKRWLRARVNPWYAHRRSLMNQVAPRWLPPADRTEAMWDRIDEWGWLPGREEVKPEDLPKAEAATAGYYAPLFAKFSIAPDADRALRQLITEARAAGVQVAFLVMPEAASFRKLIPPQAAFQAQAHLVTLLVNLKVPLIDARGWSRDDELPDGFHLLQSGADGFTRRLGAAVAETFPGLK